MSLIFVGRLGLENYKDDSAPEGQQYKKRPSQQFKSGTMRFKESFKGKQTMYEDVLGAESMTKLY